MSRAKAGRWADRASPTRLHAVDTQIPSPSGSVCLPRSPRKKARVARLQPQRTGQASSRGGCCLFSRRPLTSPLLGCFHCSAQGVRLPLKPDRSGTHVEGEYGDAGPRELRSLTEVSPWEATTSRRVICHPYPSPRHRGSRVWIFHPAPQRDGGVT